MDLSLTEEQQLLQDSARDFLRQECPTTHVRAMEEDVTGYSPELWQKITALGWAGLMFPEQYGGSGYTFVELCVLMEECGRALLPSPFHSTVLIFGLPILYGGSEAQKARYLPAIVDGKHLGTLRGPEHPHNMAWGDDDGRTLYLTAQTSVYRVRLNIPGIRP